MKLRDYALLPKPYACLVNIKSDSNLDLFNPSKFHFPILACFNVEPIRLNIYCLSIYQILDRVCTACQTVMYALVFQQ